VIEIQMSERQRQDVVADITPERDTPPCSFEAGDATLGSFFIRVTSSRIAEDASMLHERRHAAVSLLALWYRAIVDITSRPRGASSKCKKIILSRLPILLLRYPFRITSVIDLSAYL